MSDRAQRRAADLAHALGDRVGNGEDLVRLLVEQQVVIAEMRPGNVPVEVLRLQVEREDVGEQHVQRGREVLGRLGAEVATGVKRRRAAQPGLFAEHGQVSLGMRHTSV